MSSQAPVGHYRLRILRKENHSLGLGYLEDVMLSWSDVSQSDRLSELVFHGARVWPYENEPISFEDACNTYRFVAELHGMLQAMLKSDKPGQAIKLRHYAKWMRQISNPAADMFFRMASAITRNPDKEFEVKPPPLVVSYEE